jgi:hypothetical protein
MVFERQIELSGNSYSLNDNQITRLTSWCLPTVTATMAYPGHQPVIEGILGEFGIGLRDESGNQFLGWTVTRPDADELVYAPSYLDGKDRLFDEDYFVARLTQ